MRDSSPDPEAFLDKVVEELLAEDLAGDPPDDRPLGPVDDRFGIGELEPVAGDMGLPPGESLALVDEESLSQTQARLRGRIAPPPLAPLAATKTPEHAPLRAPAARPLRKPVVREEVTTTLAPSEREREGAAERLPAWAGQLVAFALGVGVTLLGVRLVDDAPAPTQARLPAPVVEPASHLPPRDLPAEPPVAIEVDVARETPAERPAVDRPAAVEPPTQPAGHPAPPAPASLEPSRPWALKTPAVTDPWKAPPQKAPAAPPKPHDPKPPEASPKPPEASPKPPEAKAPPEPPEAKPPAEEPPRDPYADPPPPRDPYADF